MAPIHDCKYSKKKKSNMKHSTIILMRQILKVLIRIHRKLEIDINDTQFEFTIKLGAHVQHKIILFNILLLLLNLCFLDSN